MYAFGLVTFAMSLIYILPARGDIGASILEDGRVARRRLTDDWSIELSEDFRARTEEGALQLVGPGGRTLWVGVQTPPPTRAPEAILDEILQDVHLTPEQKFRESGSDSYEVRYASWYPEDGRWRLDAYTVRRGSYVQLAVLSEHAGDLDWALETWRSLRYAKTPVPRTLLRPA